MPFGGVDDVYDGAAGGVRRPEGIRETIDGDHLVGSTIGLTMADPAGAGERVRGRRGCLLAGRSANGRGQPVFVAHEPPFFRLQLPDHRVPVLLRGPPPHRRPLHPRLQVERSPRRPVHGLRRNRKTHPATETGRSLIFNLYLVK